MLIGVPKEIKKDEHRVGLAPASVHELVVHGHEVIIETNAGTSIGFSDDVFRGVGAEIGASAEEVFARADMIVKVKEPQPSEYPLLREGQVLFTYLHLAPDPQQTAALVAEAVRYPYSDIMTTEALLPDRTPDGLLELLQKESTESRILVVGHLPHLARLAETLTGGGDLVFENAGLTCLEMSSPKTARLEFHLQAVHLDI